MSPQSSADDLSVAPNQTCAAQRGIFFDNMNNLSFGQLRYIVEYSVARCK